MGPQCPETPPPHLRSDTDPKSQHSPFLKRNGISPYGTHYMNVEDGGPGPLIYGALALDMWNLVSPCGALLMNSFC